MIDKRKVVFNSSLSECFTQFLEERSLLGYKDEVIPRLLAHFDRHCHDYGHVTCSLPKELVLLWIKREPHWQSSSTQQHRITLMRKLADYMIRKGLDAYRVPKSYWPKTKTQHIPYIFSHQEIKVFFEAVDSLPGTRYNENRSDVKLLYRMLYCCGLRISEALHLRIQDVDTENGILTILGAKNCRDRYVPMSDELNAMCRRYKLSLLNNYNDSNLFFPSPKGGAYSKDWIYHLFRDILRRCKIPHRGRLFGPRLHDFRHTFSVHSLENSISEGRDAMEFLPVLAAYLGHKTYHGTSTYLHLTPEAYPYITGSTEEMARRLFEDLEVEE